MSKPSPPRAGYKNKIQPIAAVKYNMSGKELWGLHAGWNDQMVKNLISYWQNVSFDHNGHMLKW